MSKKKTEEQKRLEGTDRVDRSGEIPSTDQIPLPRNGFPKEALGFYYEICQHLKENNALQTIDRLPVERAALCLLRIDQIEELLKKPKIGLIQEFKNGTRNISPEFSLLQKTEKQLIDYFGLLGISPKARHLMAGSFEKKKEEIKDPFKQVLGGTQPGAA